MGSVQDEETQFYNFTDQTKRFWFSAAGITTATTRKIQVPDAEGTLALLDGDTFLDSTFRISYYLDTSAKLAVNLAGISIGTTRTWTPPDADGTPALLEIPQTWQDDQTYWAGGSSSVVLNRFGIIATESSSQYSSISSVGLSMRDLGSGFPKVQWIDSTPSAGNLYPAGVTSSPVWLLPDASGTVAILDIAQTFASDVTIVGALQVSGLDLSGGVLLSVGEISNVGGLSVRGLPVLSSTDLESAADAAAGYMAYNVLTAQSAAITSKKLTNGTPAGMYRVTYYLEDTTTQVGAATVQLQVTATDNRGARTQSSAAITLIVAGATPVDSGSFVVKLVSGNITWATVVTGSIGAGRYALDIRAEYIGP